MNKKTMWTVQWSESQKCFHVDCLDKMMKGNLGIFIHPNNCNDWSLLAITQDHHEAHEIANMLREKRGIKNVFERFSEEHP